MRSARRPTRCAGRRPASRGRSRSSPARLQAPAAAGRGHLRARQLRACRDLRQAPDRALHRHSGRGGRAQYRDRLPSAARSPDSCFWPSRSPAAATTSSSSRAAPRRGRAHRRHRQRSREPARRGLRHRAADRGGPGAQRRRDQDLRRDARRAAAARRAWTGDAALDAAIGRLPDRLAAATELDWSAALDALGDAGA